MPAGEWLNLHPEHCNALLEAWKTKQDREAIQLASMQLHIAHCTGIKINKRAPRLRDFLPDHLRDDGSSDLMALWEANQPKHPDHGTQ